MPAQMIGRPVIRKQTDYGFYRPAAYQIANALADLPFSATRILLYDIIIYFMSHLERSAGRFFTFHLINYITFLTMQGFFRTIGLFFSNYHSAYRMAVCIFPNLILYAGYMVPINQMKRWLFWIVSLLPGIGALFIDLITSRQFYINPVNYGWSALMENEFQRLTVCVPPFHPLGRCFPLCTAYL
jgi:ABC-type multidrug transport system permease subunit